MRFSLSDRERERERGLKYSTGLFECRSGSDYWRNGEEEEEGENRKIMIEQMMEVANGQTAAVGGGEKVEKRAQEAS